MLAVTGGKGGVGKTTTALGVAAAAARAGARPVVLDADRDCPDLAAAAGTDGRGLSRLADGDSLRVAGTTVAGVTVLGARVGVESEVDTALDRLAEADRLVIADCPAGAGRPVARALRHASEALVVVRPTRRALVDGRKAAAMARRLDAPPVGVAVSRAERAPRVASLFDAPLSGCVPRVADARPWRAAERAHERLYRSFERQNA